MRSSIKINISDYYYLDLQRKLSTNSESGNEVSCENVKMEELETIVKEEPLETHKKHKKKHKAEKEENTEKESEKLEEENVSESKEKEKKKKKKKHKDKDADRPE